MAGIAKPDVVLEKSFRNFWNVYTAEELVDVLTDLEADNAALREAGQVMADILHGNLAECAQCGLSHAHHSDCPVGGWLRAGGLTRFTIDR